MRTVLAGASLVERIVAPTSVALPVAKGQKLGRVEVFDGQAARRVVAISSAAAGIARARPASKALWFAGETADNLWGIVT